jgi:hypothetical protein
MVAMKSRLFILLVCATLVPAVCARAKTILPDACGDDKVTFEVKPKKDQPAPAPPAAGKAQIIFVEDQNSRYYLGFLTVRYGVDGAWVGANNGNSYFALTVDPGLHHLCVSGQDDKHMVEAVSFTAEPDKVYYFAAQIAVTGGGGGGFVSPATGPGVTNGGGGFVGGSRQNKAFSFSQLSEDEGKYRVKAWKLANFKICTNDSCK